MQISARLNPKALSTQRVLRDAFLMPSERPVAVGAQEQIAGNAQHVDMEVLEDAFARPRETHLPQARFQTLILVGCETFHDRDRVLAPDLLAVRIGFELHLQILIEAAEGGFMKRFPCGRANHLGL